MKHEGDDRRRLRTILVTSVFAAIYLSLVWLNLSEAERRSATLEIFPTGADYLRVDINVVHVDLLRSEMTTRISFRVAGQLSEDDTSPKTDLQLVLNTVHGQQQFDFAKGQRINPIEAAFALEGNINLYPFDRHKGVLWLFVTMPGSRQTGPTANIVPGEVTNSPGLPISPTSLEKRVQAATWATFTGSIPGLTFRGSQSVRSVDAFKGLTGIEVSLKRSPHVMFISLVTMLMMAAMAVGLVTMVFQVVGRSRHMAGFHIPMAVSLIFGLPALRNIQPGVPPPGTFGDALAFTWAEMAAAASAVALIGHWLFNRKPTGSSAATKS